jgi:hypothetical protein
VRTDLKQLDELGTTLPAICPAYSRDEAAGNVPSVVKRISAPATLVLMPTRSSARKV